MTQRSKTILKWTLSAAIVVGSLYYATRNLDFIKLWEALRGANYVPALLTIPVMLLSHWFRAERWKTMLKPICKADSVWNMFSAVMVGYAFNNITPRGGEFVRPWVYSKREHVSYSSVFATIIVERIIDMISLGILLGFGIYFMSSKVVDMMPTEIDPNKLLFVVALFFIAMISSFYPPFVRFCLRTFVKPISGKLYDRLSQIFEKFRHGFEIIRTPSQYVRLALESAIIWFLYALPLYIMFYCFDFHVAHQMGMADAFMLLIVTGIGVTIAPTPGAIGVYHSIVVIYLTKLYNVDANTAFAYATVAHGMSFLVQVIFGGLFFIRERITKIPDHVKMALEENELNAPIVHGK
ncbi:MAG: lysylphosphatidylglycerol synthase transmembrane domain-containing protein [Chloroflexota bacterium]